MSKLIIIRGNSGSGKSTIAKRLQHELGYKTMLIPQDIVRREMLRTKDKPGNPSIQLIRELAEYGRCIGYDVIIEGILVRERYGGMLRELMDHFEDKYVYYFDIPFAETLSRHSLKHNSHEFGEKEMREWWLENDILKTENEKIINEKLSEEEIVSLILSDANKERKY